MTNRITRFVAAIGLTAAALGAGGGLYAATQNQNTAQQPPPFSGRRGPGRMFGPMGFLAGLRELNLTDGQRQQLKALADSHRDEWRALADRARTAHDALNAAVTADTIDEGLIRQKSADVAAVDADLALARARAHSEMLQILTPDQRAQLKTLQQNHHGRGRR